MTRGPKSGTGSVAGGSRKGKGCRSGRLPAMAEWLASDNFSGATLKFAWSYMARPTWFWSSFELGHQQKKKVK